MTLFVEGAKPLGASTWPLCTPECSMSTVLAYDLTSSLGVLCPLLSAACVILPEASVAAPPFGWSPHPRRLCSISWNSANTSFIMPSAQGPGCLFSLKLFPHPPVARMPRSLKCSRGLLQYPSFTFLSCPLVEERTQCAKCRVCDIYEQ